MEAREEAKKEVKSLVKVFVNYSQDSRARQKER
jgi:hypothetical protein